MFCTFLWKSAVIDIANLGGIAFFFRVMTCERAVHVRRPQNASAWSACLQVVFCYTFGCQRTIPASKPDKVQSKLFSSYLPPLHPRITPPVRPARTPWSCLVVRSRCGRARCSAAGPPGSRRRAIGAASGLASRGFAVRLGGAPRCRGAGSDRTPRSARL